LEERCLLGCYTVWLFLQELHGVASQKTPFFILKAVKTSNLTYLNFTEERSWAVSVLYKCEMFRLVL
jgi:hypothetical protein